MTFGQAVDNHRRSAGCGEPTMGKTVIIVSPDKHLGGLSSGGPGFTDTGNKAVIGGLARKFYHRVWKHYNQPAAWVWEKCEEYGNKGQGTPVIDGEQRTMWIFEPHVAEQVFEELIKEHRIPVHRNEWLDRKSGVKKSGSDHPDNRIPFPKPAGYDPKQQDGVLHH